MTDCDRSLAADQLSGDARRNRSIWMGPVP
jgi:hypothetical protein